MKYTIIEDCSPYYIRFTHSGIEKIVEYFNHNSNDYYNYLGKKSFVHYKLDSANSDAVLKLIPFDLDFTRERVSLFVTKPNSTYNAHKDGLAVRCGINYGIVMQDDLCVTNWYSDQDLSGYDIHTLGGVSREITNFDRTKHIPIKSMTARQGECVLFNTEIYHDWDNSRSSNIRVNLTLRFNQPHRVYFEDIRKQLFGY